MRFKKGNKQTQVLGALTVCIVILMSSLPGAKANVIGFDFGSTFFKVTLVQPGNPFQIVENTAGGRKTESMMTIAPEQRLFGKDSITGSSRFYQQTFYDVLNMLGLEHNEENLRDLKEKFVLNDFVQDERGLFAYQSFSLDSKSDDKIEYFTEEIVGMILKYGRELAEHQAKGLVKDAVITVPSYFNQEKRQMMITAAELAGLHVEQLVHENTAAATMYGIDRMDSEKDLHVLIYNMGGRDTEVSVVRYSAITDPKTNKTVEYVEIMGEGWDETLGGYAFDHVLVKILADKFNEMPERKGKIDIRENARAMRRLYKESGKTKDVLSANKITDVKVAELHDYDTLKFKLERADYEEAAHDLFARVQAPIQQALDQAGLTVEDIDQVEILGGGLRVPKVQEIIKETMKTDELHVHLNADEAMCFGSAFIASNSSSSFKVRKVYLTQHPQHGFKIEIKPIEPIESNNEEVEEPDCEEGEECDKPISYNKEVILYKKTDYLGQRKTINVIYDKGMQIDVFAVWEAEGEDEPKLEPLITYKLPELDEIAKKDVVIKEGSTKPKVSLNFELTRSHLFNLKSASVSVDETIIEEIIPEKKKEEKKETNADTEESSGEEGQKSEQSEDESKEGETDTSEEKLEENSEEQSGSNEEEVVEKEFKERIENHVFPVEINETLHGCRLLNKDQIKEAKKRQTNLEKRDEEKKLTDEAKNSFESLIYEFRDFLRDENNFVYVKESDRESLMEKTETAENWLYDEGSDAGYKVYQEKSYELMTDYTKFKNRKEQAVKREEAIPEYLELLATTKTMAIEVTEKMPWVTEQEQNDLLEKVDETRVWLDGKIEAQAALSPDEDPVFTVEDIASRMKKVDSLAKKVFSKKKPKEPKKKKEEEEKTEEKEDKKDGEEDVINLDDKEFDKDNSEKEEL